MSHVRACMMLQEDPSSSAAPQGIGVLISKGTPYLVKASMTLGTESAMPLSTVAPSSAGRLRPIVHAHSSEQSDFHRNPSTLGCLYAIPQAPFQQRPSTGVLLSCYDEIHGAPTAPCTVHLHLHVKTTLSPFVLKAQGSCASLRDRETPLRVH